MNYNDKKALIFLTGFMGSGKSTIGPILANTLGYNFIDTDNFIEKKAGKKIDDIFKIDGEPVFRQLEKDCLKEILSSKNYVVSLGGGMVVNSDNSKLILENGLLVYLKASPREIKQRVENKNDRPMLKDVKGVMLKDEELLNRIIALLDKREQYYMQANIVVSTDNKTVGDTVEEIVKKIHSHSN